MHASRCVSSSRYKLTAPLLILNSVSNSWAIPVCMFFSWVYMRPKYHWTQILVSPQQLMIPDDYLNFSLVRAFLFVWRGLDYSWRPTKSPTRTGQRLTEPKGTVSWLLEQRFMALVHIRLSLSCWETDLVPHSKRDGGVFRQKTPSLWGLLLSW